jgi:hypothetical protein
VSSGGVYGDRYCSIHGYYWGAYCPGCTTSVPPPQPTRWDRTGEIIDVLNRIAASLERLASSQDTDPAKRPT